MGKRLGRSTLCPFYRLTAGGTLWPSRPVGTLSGARVLSAMRSQACLPGSGGGGVVSTTEDYLRFCQMFLNGGTFDGKRLLSRKTVELMTGNYVSTAIPTVEGGWID